MKSVKWFYVGAMAIALGMLTFATVACHDDDDDPKPAEGEVIETPKPVVEYYIMGTVTSGGEAMNGVKVKVGSKNYTTIIRKSKFPQNPKRSVRFSGKRTKRSVQKRKARNTQKAETKVL